MTRDALPGMRFVPGGDFTMGSERFYPEEAPRRRVSVDGFWMDVTPVTNRQFAEFIEATGHVTLAEIAPDPKDYPGMPADLARPGSLVFTPTLKPVELNDAAQWWCFEFGADWRHPTGRNSSLVGLADHPVVHIAWSDASAYSAWADKQLPTEAEFEYAARGGLDGAEFAWGDELAPGGKVLANYWQGAFPVANTRLDGWQRTSPVQNFPANGYGLFDLIGNVWEWTQDWWAVPNRQGRAGRPCCAVSNPRGGALRESFDLTQPQIRIGRKVIKGGSHLCAENYCQRYRPAARHPETVDTSTSHIGFRCVIRNPR